MLTYTVSASDGVASDTQDVVITITGSNDAPLISVEAGDSASAGLTETNAGLTVSDTLTVRDLDDSDTVSNTRVVAVGGTYAGGSNPTNAALLAMLTVTPGPITADSSDVNNLVWSFDSGSEAFDYLAAGETLVLTYTVSASDGVASDTQDVVITITGSNDAPLISVEAGDSASAGLTETNAGLTVSDTLTVRDLDDSDTVSNTRVVAVGGTYAGGSNPTNAALLAMLTVTPGPIAADSSDVNNLVWSFDSGSEAFDYLAAGETLVLTYTVSASDGVASDTQDVVITITGSNDAPLISVEAGDSASAGLTETNAGLTVSDTLTVRDLDDSDTVSNTRVVAVGGTYAGGSNPTNAALLAMLTVTPGPITADSGDVNNLVWSFDSGSEAFDYLAAGETLVLTYTVSASDGVASDTQDVVITITGSNDAPLISVEAGDSASAGLTETNAGLTVSDTLTVRDLDDSDTVSNTRVVAVGGTYAGGSNPTNAALLAMLTVTPGPIAADSGDVNNLVWSFDSGSEAFDYLAAGETLVLTYTVSASDGVASDTQDVVITITGSNDAPLISVRGGRQCKCGPDGDQCRADGKRYADGARSG